MFLFLMLISLLFLSGCWSKKELPELAIISAVGIDKNEEGKFVKTHQFINPNNVAGGLQGGGGGQGPSVSVYTSTGDNILEAHFRASTKVSRRLYHSHANLLVISEEVAREEGIQDILDAFERDPEIRTTMTIVIAKGRKAGDIITSLTSIDRIPAEKVNKTLETTEKMFGEHIKVSIQESISILESSGRELVITGFRQKGDSEKGKKLENIQNSELDATLEADGLAIFKEGKLIDWFHDEDARGVVWILDKVKETNVNIDWEKKKDAIAYQVIRQKTKVSADVKNGKPAITIHVRAEGDIREVVVPVDLTDPKVIANIEKGLGKEIEKELKDSINLAQKNKSDIFGFGETVQRSYPDAWRKMKNNWHDVTFPDLKVNVKVEAFIRRTGLRTNSYLSQMEINR
ncbi:Ger(x)C family spore germination protein [Domibacillus epiphyticus]